MDKMLRVVDRNVICAMLCNNKNKNQFLNKAKIRWTKVNSNQFKLDQPLVPALEMNAKYRPAPILCQPNFNFNATARLFTVSGLS